MVIIWVLSAYIKIYRIIIMQNSVIEVRIFKFQKNKNILFKLNIWCFTILSIINEIIANKNSYMIDINFGLTFNFEVLSLLYFYS